MGRLLRGVFSLERLLGYGLLMVFVALYIADPFPVAFLRIKTFDTFQRLKPRELPPPAGKPVTIIDLDEKSLAEFGQWPWPRSIVARLVGNLIRMGASVVAFDIVFAEPDRMNPAAVASSIPGLDDETRARLNRLPGNDALLAEVLGQGRTVLGQAGYWDDRPAGESPPIKKSIAIKGPKPHRFLPTYRSLVRNIPVLEVAATGHGIFTLVSEQDGIVRRVPALFAFGGDLYPALSVEMLRVATGRQTILVETEELGIKAVKIARGLTIPTDLNGRIWPYFSKRDPAKYVSAGDILNGTADAAMIRGKLTIIGTSAVGLLDVRSTPVDEIIPGVEVHAQIIEAAATGAFLSRPNNIRGAELILLAVGSLLMIWLVPAVGARWTMALFLLVAGAAAGMSWYLFAEKRILFDSGFAAVSMLLLYTVLTYAGHAKEEAQRRQIRDAFGKYLSPAMVKRVADDPSQLKLGGDRRELTLLFCDVRGFTTISEQFDAVGLTRLINKLLTPLTNVILERRGTVDKYMGDCIMAFWNAPMDDEDHARNGCLAALEMLSEMKPLNERLAGEARETGRTHIPLRVGLGLNTGECVVGNMGSDQRFDYSVLGDTVNTAARLEGQSKTYGVDIVIGENTRALVPDLATIEIDLIQVKGKTVGIHIHALLGDADQARDEGFAQLRAANAEMLERYRGRDWAAARERLADCRRLGQPFGLGALYDLYEERIAAYEKNPPDPGWDGVFIATTK